MGGDPSITAIESTSKAAVAMSSSSESSPMERITYDVLQNIISFAPAGYYAKYRTVNRFWAEQVRMLVIDMNGGSLQRLGCAASQNWSFHDVGVNESKAARLIVSILGQTLTEVSVTPALGDELVLELLGKCPALCSLSLHHRGSVTRILHQITRGVHESPSLVMKRAYPANQAAQLHTLVLNACPMLSRDGFEALHLLPSLRVLHLENVDPNVDTVLFSKVVKSLRPSLMEFSIMQARWLTSYHVMVLSTLRYLTSLRIGGAPLLARGDDVDLGEFAHCPRLTRLEFSNCELNGAVGSQLRRLKHVEQLSFTVVKFSPLQPFMRDVVRMKALKSLHIASRDENDAFVAGSELAGLDDPDRRAAITLTSAVIGLY